MSGVLFRSPLVRLALRLWWLPAVGATLWWVVSGGQEFRLVLLGLATGLVAFGTFVLGAWVVEQYLILRDEARHQRAGHRFLCPECLHFGPFRFACGSCGSEVAPLVVHTDGSCFNECARCHTRLFPTKRSASPNVKAYCARCLSPAGRARYHARQVRVLGALHDSDFTAFCDAAGRERGLKNDAVGVFDDGMRLTYVLSLAHLPASARSLPGNHALWAMTAIWIDGAGVEPLALGGAVDRFIQESGCAEKQLRAMTVWVREAELPPAADRLLTSRFGSVQYGVEARTMLERGSAGWDVVPLPPSHLMPLPSSTGEANDRPHHPAGATVAVRHRSFRLTRSQQSAGATVNRWQAQAGEPRQTARGERGPDGDKDRQTGKPGRTRVR